MNKLKRIVKRNLTYLLLTAGVLLAIGTLIGSVLEWNKNLQTLKVGQ